RRAESQAGAVQSQVKQGEKTQGRLETAKVALEKAREAASRKAFLEGEVGMLKQQVKAGRELDEAREAERLLENEFKKFTHSIREAEQSVRVARGELDLRQRQWVEGQARVLAEGLLPGKPCPVCGSRDHPGTPQAVGEVPKEEMVQGARLALVEIEQLFLQWKEALAGCESERAATGAKIRGLEQTLGDNPDRTLKELQELCAGKRELLTEAVEAQRTLSDVEDAYHRLEGEMSLAIRRLEEARERLNGMGREQAAAEKLVVEREGKLPERWRNPEVLEQGIASRKTELERAESALREARELHKSRGGLLVGAETALKSAKKRHSEVKEQLSRLEGQWRQRRDGLGFTHDDGFSAALRDDSAQETLETAIHSYDTDMQRALTTRDNAEKEARGLKRPDLSQLEEAERKAREERKTEARNLVAAEESRKMLEKLHQN
ncbi:MAG: hypothetical protein GY731_10865, partial [Gammaproteobacteria bacterium]|nr:hypothetical protein [Gammaproteobacteria bacterium]